MEMTRAKQNVVNIIWKRIIATESRNDADARQEIYTFFTELLEKGIAEARIMPEARDVLKEAIVSIERELSFDSLVNSTQEKEHLLKTNLPPEPAQEQSEAKTSAKTSKGGAGKLIAAIIVAAAVASGAYYYFTQPPAATVPIADAGAGVGANTIDLSALSTDPQGTRPAISTINFEVVGDGPNRVARVTGPLNLYSSEYIQIDTDKKYELKVRLRLLPSSGRDERTTIVYAGMSTYDVNGTLQTDPPGSHRYAILAAARVSSDDGWIERSAIVTGAGNERTDQFRVGSVAMRLLVLANYNSDAANEVEISSMSWRQVD